MCELVKVNVLAPPIVEMCAEKLTESQKENAIDCLHVILKHAGNALDFVRFTAYNRLVWKNFSVIYYS